MRPLPFVWPYAAVFWLLTLWIYAPEFAIVGRGGKNLKSADSKDSGSMAVIMLGQWVALFAGYPAAFVPRFRVPPSLNLAFFAGGMLVMLAGSLLRRHCFRILGEFFTGNVQARADQPVIDRGAYHFVRHPSYTGGILMFIGTGLALGSWASVAILFVASVAVYAYRIHVEERALLQTIGEPYAAYMRSRKRLIPFIV